MGYISPLTSEGESSPDRYSLSEVGNPDEHDAVPDVYTTLSHCGETLFIPVPAQQNLCGIYTADLFSSTISAADLDQIESLYSIPPFVTCLRPRPFRGVSEPPPHFLSVYTAAFCYGLRLPFPLPVARILHQLGLAPAQLIPESWRYLIGSCSLWSTCGFPYISLEEFYWFFLLLPCPIGRGFYFIIPRPDRAPLLLSDVVTPNRDWARRWFWVQNGCSGIPDEHSIHSSFSWSGTCITSPN